MATPTKPTKRMATPKEYLRLALTDVEKGDIKQAFRRRKFYLNNPYSNELEQVPILEQKPVEKPKLKLQLKKAHNTPEQTTPPAIPSTERATPQPSISGPPAPPPIPITAIRTKVKDQVDNLYDSFWWHDSAFMQRKIDAVHVDNQPDLQARIERLTLLNTARLRLNRGERFRNRETRLVMKRIIGIFFDNSARAVDQKEEIIQSITQLQDPREIKQAIIALKSDTPEVYQMEKDFIDNLHTILKSVSKPGTSSGSNDSDQEPTAKETGCGCIIILIVIAGIVKLCLRLSGN